jgi:benzoate-CoA ligase family protein
MTEPHEPYNAAAGILGTTAAGPAASADYLRTEDRPWSYQEVAETADGVGAALLDLGLVPGDRVIITTRDRPEFVIAFWAAIKAGLVAVPIAGGLSAADLRFVLEDSGARLVLCDPSTAGAVADAAEGADVIVAVAGEAAPAGARSWDDLAARPAALAPAPTVAGDIALWLYTSGTTGEPKAVMHRHAHLRAATTALASQVVGLGPDDVVLSVSKMFFAYGLGNSVYLPASVGAAVVVDDGPAIPGRVDALLPHARPTVMFGVPAFLDGLARLPEAALPDSVRMVISAGESLAPDILERFHGRFGLPPLDGLGATEALHHVTSNRADDVVPGSAGRPLAGYEVRVLSPEQEPVPDGRAGELWVTGPTTFAGYWRRPELTERAYRGEWMRTGDLVRIEDGRVFHEGRLDDLMKIGGIWVAPKEIEALMRTHPSVSEAAVVEVDEGDGVPVLKAYIVATGDERNVQADLRRLCREHLSGYKVPRLWEFVPELPRTQTGKLRRFALRRREPQAGGS